MLLIDDYKLEYKLGSGSFADVYYTSKKNSKEIFATKRVEKAKALSEKMKNYFLNEVDILKNTNHKNIIKLYEIKNSQKNFYLIMEYCNGGTLQDLFERYNEKFLKPFPESFVQHILRQISCGLYYLHKSNIIHRDLKMENILFHFDSKEDLNKMNILKSQIKIIDFGFAKYLTDSTVASSICGSPINMDPMILKALAYKQIGNDFGYTEKADMWSLGIMVYTMLIGKPPFIASNYKDLYTQINKGNYHIPKQLKLSKQAISLINGMLQFDTKERLSIDELIFHEFLTLEEKEFEYCDLNYIDKGQSEITLNNKEDINKIWDNYQVSNNNNLNLAKIRGNLGDKSIIDEMEQNNLNKGDYDSNKHFQAFYIDEKNNIVFKNPNDPDPNADKKTEKTNLPVILPNFLNGLTPNPANDKLRQQLMNRDESQLKLADRIKQYEDQGKEFKKISEMLQQNNILKETEKINLEQIAVKHENNKKSSSNSNNQIITNNTTKTNNTNQNQNNNINLQNKPNEYIIQDPKPNSISNANNNNYNNDQRVVNNNPMSVPNSDRSGTPSNFIPIEKKPSEVKYNHYLPPNKQNVSPITTTTQNYFNNAADLKINIMNTMANAQNLLSITSYDQKYKDMKLTSTTQNYLSKFEAENQKKVIGQTNILENNQLEKYREYLDGIMNNKPVNTNNNVNDNAILKTQETQRSNGVYTNNVYDNNKIQPIHYQTNNQNVYNPVSNNNTNPAETTSNFNIPLTGNQQNNFYYNQPKDSNVKTTNYLYTYPENTKLNTFNYAGNNALNGQEQVKNTYEQTSAAKPIQYSQDNVNDYLKNLNLYQNQETKKTQVPNQQNIDLNNPNRNLNSGSKKILADLKKQIMDSIEKLRILNGNPDNNSNAGRIFSTLNNINNQIEGAINLCDNEGK